MATKLGILVVHGMGCQQPGFAAEMIDSISALLTEERLEPSDVCWQPVYWADLVQPAEDRIWKAVSRHHDLSYVTLRQFVISYLGDAIAYQRVPGQQEGVYQRIHECVHQKLVALRRTLDDQDKPLMIIAHSLGCAIMSNYIWDRQHGYDAHNSGANPFERMETLCGMITFGCNIPLFVLAYAEIVAIQFPPPTLPPALRPKAKWSNYFDTDDVLGYPLRPLSPTYEQAVTEDVEINVGGILTSWNPLSHTAYWSDDGFIKRVTKEVREVLSAL